MPSWFRVCEDHFFVGIPQLAPQRSHSTLPPPFSTQMPVSKPTCAPALPGALTGLSPRSTYRPSLFPCHSRHHSTVPAHPEPVSSRHFFDRHRRTWAEDAADCCSKGCDSCGVVQCNLFRVPCVFLYPADSPTVLTCTQKLADRADISSSVFMRTTQQCHKQTVEYVWVRPVEVHPPSTCPYMHSARSPPKGSYTRIRMKDTILRRTSVSILRLVSLHIPLSQIR